MFHKKLIFLSLSVTVRIFPRFLRVVDRINFRFLCPKLTLTFRAVSAKIIFSKKT